MSLTSIMRLLYALDMILELVGGEDDGLYDCLL